MNKNKREKKKKKSFELTNHTEMSDSVHSWFGIKKKNKKTLGMYEVDFGWIDVSRLSVYFVFRKKPSLFVKIR